MESQAVEDKVDPEQNNVAMRRKGLQDREWEDRES